jgi:release factor glutamine methyltransferase
MTIEEAIIYGKKYISSTEAKMLISSVKNYNALDIINHLNEKLTEEEEKTFKSLITSRKENKPIQYITNNVNFYGIELYVDENVLIPRFETEELVENTIQYLNKMFVSPKILDLCCGSGAIGIALKNKLKLSSITMSDISNKALDVARKNINTYNYDIEIIESDLFGKINDKFDCIISNPPYIKDDEEIEEIVKNNEPNIALYGGKDGLDFYERILKEVKNYLNDKFLIAFEIGATQKEDIITIANKYLSNIEIETKKDLSGRDRMVFIYNK